MELRTIIIQDVEFDVYYEFSSERDPLGTGDSPTAFYVEVKEILAVRGNLTDLLTSEVLSEINDEIIKQECI